jgi:hypothetical protein
MHDWVVSAVGFAIGRNPAADLFYGPKRINNQSLHAACVYLLERSSTSPQLANDVAIVAAIGVTALFCWVARQPYATLDDPGWLFECAALLVLVALLSPITWEQHLVLTLPALYLITAEEVGTSDLRGAILALMLLFVLLSVVLTRDLLGKQNYDVLLGYHIQTLCMLIVFGVVLLRHPTTRQNAGRAHQKIG